MSAVKKMIFNPRVRASFSISSWFCIPEENMKDLEILSRASGFLVQAKNPEKFGRKYHFVTVSHTVAPWRWPNYYPLEWVQCVNEKHTHYTIELRADDGVFLTQLELLPRSYHHPSRDLCVLHIDDEQKVFDMLLDDLQVGGESLLPSEVDITSNTDLDFHGHELLESKPQGLGENESPTKYKKNTKAVNVEPDASNEDTRVPIPANIRGRVTLRSPKQILAATQRVLTDGMCGGPVTVQYSSLSTEQAAAVDLLVPAGRRRARSAAAQYLSVEERDERFVCGMTEGIVPLDHPREDLRGHASFIDADEIDRFVNLIEEERAESMTVLVGGQGAEWVSNDKDPNKMDYSKTLAPYLDQ